MQNNEQISEKQLTFLLLNIFIVKMIFSFTRELFTECGNSAWIEALFMSLVSLLFLELSFLCYKICGKKTIIDVAFDSGGKLFRYIVAILCLFVLFANFIVEIRMFFESLKIVLLPRTRLEIIMLLVAIAVIIAAGKGIFAIATVNAIFFPLCLVFLALIGVFLINNYHINNLFPILGEGTRKIAFGGIKNLYCFSDLLVLNLIMPHAKDIGAVKRSGRKAVIIAGSTLVLICICYALCYPASRAKEFLLPIYQLTRMIRAGEYFQRFEAFFEFVFTITELLYITIYLYVISETISKAFYVPNINTVAYSVTALSFFLAIEAESVVEALEISSYFGIIIYPIAFLLPIIVPLIYLPKKRKEEK